jgi:hypothetical protein
VDTSKTEDHLKHRQDKWFKNLKNEGLLHKNMDRTREIMEKTVNIEGYQYTSEDTNLDMKLGLVEERIIYLLPVFFRQPFVNKI